MLCDQDCGFLSMKQFPFMSIATVHTTVEPPVSGHPRDQKKVSA